MRYPYLFPFVGKMEKFFDDIRACNHRSVLPVQIRSQSNRSRDNDRLQK